MPRDCIIRVCKFDMEVIHLCQFVSGHGPPGIFQTLFESEDVEEILQGTVGQGNPVQLDSPQSSFTAWF